MRNYGPNGLEIRVGDGHDATIRYYVSEIPGRGWRWDAYLGDFGGMSAGHSETFSSTRDDAVTAVAEHYVAHIATCFHPRSCPSCNARGTACGAHTPGRSGHEYCTGR